MVLTNNHNRKVSYVLILVVGLATALLVGKDLTWDSLAYHVYAGYSVMENRLDLDYFAASTQGYLNPYAHVPFYLMLKQGLAPQWIASLLAVVHLLNLLIVYEVARLLNRRQDGTVAWPPVALGVLLAFLNPVFILELGSSFNEISTSVPLLLGWYLLMYAFHKQQLRWIVLAGVLIGLAAALKLTNLLYSVTALPLLLMAPGSTRTRLRALALFAAAGVLGAVAGGGWWAWQMWEMFGNPFFPMFNQIFQSPEFVTGNIKHYRFLPVSLGDALIRPFRMALPFSNVHIEPVAPDLRYATLVLLLGLFGVKAASRQLSGPALKRIAPFAHFQSTRLLLALSLSLAMAWVIWIITSGNSRYFLPMSCLVAVILASLMARFSSQPRFFAYAGALVLCLQAWATCGVADHRWYPSQWGDTWFELTIPPELQQQPQLYLNVGVLPASFMLPYLAPGSSMINLGGQFPLVENARIRALFDKYKGRIRVMRLARKDMPPARIHFEASLISFDLEADLDSCLTVVSLQRKVAPEQDERFFYLSCNTRPLQWSAAKRAEFAARKQRADDLFERLEQLCPQYFQPRGLRSEGDEQKFTKSYINTDIIVDQYASGRVYLHNDVTFFERNIGDLATLAHTLPKKSELCP